MADSGVTAVADSPPVSTGAPGTRDTWRLVSGIVILALWFGMVLTTVLRHEYWCDEVRALSIARMAHSPLELFRLLKNDGHPILWYAILSLGNFIGRPSWILPVAGVTLAAAAVAIFLFCAPFARWFQALFIFSFLPLYEYSVMARNYGLTMLMLFLFAWAYPNRSRWPWLPAVFLFLLANSHFLGTIAAFALTLMWLVDTDWRSPPRRLLREAALPMAIILAGAALACMTVALGSDAKGPQHDAATLWKVPASIPLALLPYHTFATLIPTTVTSWASDAHISAFWALFVFNAFIWAAVIALAARPPLLVAGVVMLVATGVFRNLVYPMPSHRHQGIFLILLLTLYWIGVSTTPSTAPPGQWRRSLLRWGVYGVVGLIVLGYYPLTYETVGYDLLYWRSASKPFAAFIRQSPEYHDAVLMAEPGTEAEAMPYYCDNLIYLPREQRFSTINRYQNMTPEQSTLSLGTLLDRAEEVRASTGKPVLLMLHNKKVLTEASGYVVADWGYITTRFTWTPEERMRLAKECRLVADFTQTRALETYLVFALR